MIEKVERIIEVKITELAVLLLAAAVLYFLERRW